MKRFLLGGTVIFCGLLLVGCSKGKTDIGGNNKNISYDKKLVCTQKVLTVNVELNTYFKSNSINGMDMKYTMDLSGYDDTQIKAIGAQDYCTIVKNSMVGFEKAFTNCKQNTNNKELLITADFDIDKITGMEVGRNEDISQVKSEMESVGYSCVIR